MAASCATLGFAFPGQNSQHVGMLAELGQSHPGIISTFTEASDVLGYDLWQLVQTGTAEQLALTHITQPAILTASVALWRLWLHQGGALPALMAGHSLGEYSALVCAGVLRFTDAVGLVKQRGEFMQSAVPVGVGAMAAIVGLDDAGVTKACAEASGTEVVAAANFNSPGQVVIAGHSAAVQRAGELCKAAGAKRVLPLSVSAPFHSPLMKPAAEHFAEVLAGITLSTPAIPVVQNYGLATSMDPAAIRQNLVLQIYNPVPWVATVQAFAAGGITTLLELGPGKVLTGLNKRIDAGLNVLAVNDPASLATALATCCGTNPVATNGGI
jgi:[acyl-carrier-protein] S-malonyltransferase